MTQCRPLTDSVACAAADPHLTDKIFLEEVTGRRLTYSQVDDLGRHWAGLLLTHGVRATDNVVVMIPTSADVVLAWLGANWLGARFVGVNAALMGDLLGHLVAQSDAEVAVVHRSFLSRFADQVHALGRLRTIVVVGGVDGAPVLSGIRLVNADDVVASSPIPNDLAPGKPSDIYGIIHTSGTTGRSKGVLVTWKLLHNVGLDGQPGDLFGPKDVWYSPFPINHVSGAGQVYQAALIGGRVVLRESWKTSAFWPDVNRFGATVTMLIGAMAAFLTKQEPSELERRHSLRYVQMTPLPDDVPAFEGRFGFQLWTIFAMSECGTVTATELSPRVHRTCGRARDGYQLRLVDKDGLDVPDGEPGELWVRCDDPDLLMQGYYNQPEATAAVWNGPWLRTGDMLRRDAEGNYYFVDRRKDVLRRRGENIASGDIERVANDHPAVLDSAAVAVPSEHAEDEILLVVEAPGAAVTGQEVSNFLAHRLPLFMVPRYIQVVDALPRTATGKIRKELVRAEAHVDAWVAGS